jgi:hypothetical protein
MIRSGVVITGLGGIFVSHKMMTGVRYTSLIRKKSDTTQNYHFSREAI